MEKVSFFSTLFQDPRVRQLGFLAIILSLSTLGQVSADVYLPSLPAISHYFFTTESTTQLTITLYLLGFGTSHLIYGPLSDKFGRKHILLIGLMIGCIGSAVCVFAPSITWLYVGRLLQGAGLGASTALSRAIMRDTFSGTQLAKIGSYLTIVISIVLAIAPVLGGYLQHFFGWRSNFTFLFFYTVLITLVVIKKLPETNQYKHTGNLTLKSVINTYKWLLSHQLFIGYALCSSFTFAGIIAYCTISPFLLQNVLHLTPMQNGWLAIFNTFTLGVGAFINARLVPTLGINQMILIGTLLKTLSGIFLLVAALFNYLTVFSIVASFVIFCTGASLLFSNSGSGAITPFATVAGAAGALFGCIQITTASITSALMAAAPERNQLPLGIAFFSLGILSFCALRFLIGKKEFRGEGVCSTP